MARSRVFFDTNVLVSAFLAAGKPWHCFETARGGLIVLVSSVHVVNELADVLTRPHLHADPDDVATFIEDLTDLADIVPVGEVAKPAGCRDPDDELVLAAAVLGKADAIVTGDHDLLDLARPPVRTFTVDELLGELG